MDIFYEQIIKRKRKAADWVLCIGAAVLGVVLTLILVLLFFMGISLWGFNLFIVFLIWWGFIWIVRNMSVEYEYTITNHELDIDKITGKKTRKHITTINLKTIEYFGSINAPFVADKIKHSSDISKSYYLVSDKKSDNLFVTDVISRKTNNKVRVYVEPDEKLTEYIRLANPKAFKKISE